MRVANYALPLVATLLRLAGAIELNVNSIGQSIKQDFIDVAILNDPEQTLSRMLPPQLHMASARGTRTIRAQRRRLR